MWSVWSSGRTQSARRAAEGLRVPGMAGSTTEDGEDYGVCRVHGMTRSVAERTECSGGHWSAAEYHGVNRVCGASWSARRVWSSG